MLHFLNTIHSTRRQPTHTDTMEVDTLCMHSRIAELYFILFILHHSIRVLQSNFTPVSIEYSNVFGKIKTMDKMNRENRCGRLKDRRSELYRSFIDKNYENINILKRRGMGKHIPPFFSTFYHQSKRFQSLWSEWEINFKSIE